MKNYIQKRYNFDYIIMAFYDSKENLSNIQCGFGINVETDKAEKY